MSRSRTTGARDDLTGEHALGDLGQIVFALLFFAVWVLDSFVMGWSTGLNQVIPVAVRAPLGLAVQVGAGYLAVTGLSIVFGDRRDPPSVIRQGVFGVVRHPIYLSEIMLYVGCLFHSVSLAATLVAVFAALFLHRIARHEEGLLRARFGEDYAQYMREVPMWLPHRRPRRGPR